MSSVPLEPWKITPNATFEAVLVCLDDEGTEIDVTGCKARMDFKTALGTTGAALFSLNETDGLTLAGESVTIGANTYHNGVIRIIITPAKASLTENLRGSADLLIRLSDNSVYRVYTPPRTWVAMAAVTPAVFS